MSKRKNTHSDPADEINAVTSAQSAEQPADAVVEAAATEQPEQTADAPAESTDVEEKESFGTRFKNFFATLGRKIRNYFVNLGRRIKNFWVNAWRKTVRFFKNIGIFFRMIWSLLVEVKLKLDNKRAARRAKRAASQGADAQVQAETEQSPSDGTDATSQTVTAVADELPESEADQAVFKDSEADQAPDEIDEVVAMRSRFAYFFRKRTKDEWKSVLLGNNEKKGVLQLIVCYALLILFGFVYIYPMLYMLAYSLMGESDVVNPLVTYWPTEWQWSNYRQASQTLHFFRALLETAYISVLPAIFQTVACCLTAYGLARFRFPGKKLIFGLIILTFIIPPQLTMMPQLIIFTNLKFAGNVLSFMVPAAVGQGIKSAVFILIFYQFFKGIPDSVVEAAKIDGANSFKIFTNIGIPAAVPAILLSFLLSVVWYYNETVLTNVYLGTSVTTLPTALANFKQSFSQMFPDATTGKSVNEAVYMAGTLLNVLPLIIMYFFTQRYFVDGIDKAGITGE